MDILNNSDGDPIWLIYTWSTPASVDVGIGRTDEAYDEGNSNPTGYYWVPLPYTTHRAYTSAHWTDWIEWDFNASQLWWGKNITIKDWGGMGDSSENPLIYVFYYQEF
jgi:hypothetical protein